MIPNTNSANDYAYNSYGQYPNYGGHQNGYPTAYDVNYAPPVTPHVASPYNANQNNNLPSGGGPPPSGNGGNYDLEDQSYYSSDKLTAACDISIRHGFVRKVFSLVSIQLLFTFGVSLPFLFLESWKIFMIANSTVLLVFALVLVIIPIFVLSCCRNVSRTFPQNYIMLFLLTLGMTIIVAAAGSVFSVSSFAIAAGITAAVTVSLILFAIQTRIDFTSCWVFAFVAAVVMMMFFLVLLFVQSRVLYLVYASLGALLMSFYIVFDTQLIVGGKHRKYEFSIDDYVFAAASLYLDIVNLFLYLIQILNLAQ